MFHFSFFQDNRCTIARRFLADNGHTPLLRKHIQGGSCCQDFFSFLSFYDNDSKPLLLCHQHQSIREMPHKDFCKTDGWFGLVETKRMFPLINRTNKNAVSFILHFSVLQVSKLFIESYSELNERLH